MKLIDINEAAEMLSVPVSTLRYWRRVGEGPQPILIGKNLRYVEQEIANYINERRIHASSN